MKHLLVINNLINKTKKNPLVLKLIKNSIWSFLSIFLSRGLLFITWVFVARIIGAKEYGEFGIVRTTVNMFMILSGFSIGVTLTKFIAQYETFAKDNKKNIGRLIGSSLGFSLLIGVVISGIVFMSSSYISEVLLKSTEVTNLLRIGSLLLLLSTIIGAQMGVLQGFNLYKGLTKLNAVSGIVTLILVVFGSKFYNVIGTTAFFSLSLFLNVLFLQYYVMKILKIKKIRIFFKPKKTEIDIFVKFSLPAVLAGLCIAPIKWYSEKMLISNESFEVMGVFYAALIPMNLIIAAVSSVDAPLLSLASANKENSFFDKINVFSTWYIYVILSFFLFIFFDLFKFLFGENYNSSLFNKIIVLLVLYAGLYLFSQGLWRKLAVFDKMWVYFFTNLVEGFVLMVSFYFLLDLGAIGLGYAYIISYLARIFFMIILGDFVGVIKMKQMFNNKYFLLSIFFVVVNFIIAMYRV